MATTQVSNSLIKDASVTLAKMAANSIDSDQYVDGSIDLVHMSANSIDSDQYVDGSIDLVHMSANSIDSDQYVDDSIDTAHIADDAVTSAKIASVPVAVGITTVVTSTSITATVNTHVFVDTATKTITLPASPTIGQRVLLTVGNFTDTVIARNGSNIMSLAADFTMDSAYLSIQFIYTDATQGWVMS
jgi:hypothetical protein